MVSQEPVLAAGRLALHAVHHDDRTTSPARHGAHLPGHREPGAPAPAQPRTLDLLDEIRAGSDGWCGIQRTVLLQLAGTLATGEEARQARRGANPRAAIRAYGESFGWSAHHAVPENATVPLTSPEEPAIRSAATNVTLAPPASRSCAWIRPSSIPAIDP